MRVTHCLRLIPIDNNDNGRDDDDDGGDDDGDDDGDVDDTFGRQYWWYGYLGNAKKLVTLTTLIINTYLHKDDNDDGNDDGIDDGNDNNDDDDTNL